jgi:hypothetical protein
MEINLQHINTGLLSLLSFWEIAKTISRMTPSKKDDEVVERIEGKVTEVANTVKSAAFNAIDLVRQKAPYFWAVVEVGEKCGIIPDKAQKPIEFLRRLHAAIPNLPPEAVEEAKKIAASLSAEVKK